MSTEGPAFQVKYIVIGASGAGKTSILKQLIDHKFLKNSPTTVGIEYFCHQTTIEGQNLKLMIWDTAGQERFYSIARAYFRGAIGIVLVFDIADRKSFDVIPRWLRDARADADPNNVAILVGNKTDLAAKRLVSTEEAEKFAEQHNLLYIETSALENQNIEEVFYRSAKEIVHKIQSGAITEEQLNPNTAPVNPTDDEEENHEEQKKGCC